MPQTLTEIKALLDAAGLHPRKRFGQNFLIDHGKIQLILAAANLHEGDAVLEVGPGTGALTEHLLAAGAHVTAVEIDRDLCLVLRDRFAGHPRFTLIAGDVMDGKHKLNIAVAEAVIACSQVKLVANLPYNIASPLLAVLATEYPQMTGALVMIQREVAERITAAPGGRDYGPLSVILQAMCEVHLVTTLPPQCFWPRPSIDSAVVQLVRRAEPLTANPTALAAMSQTLFTRRRKQIGSILGRDRPLPAGVEPHMRPEQLTVEQIVELAEQTVD
jgi:16S rRNA (adenine1518-N6/adenine1519-N6)-dimethyltransferase